MSDSKKLDKMSEYVLTWHNSLPNVNSDNQRFIVHMSAGFFSQLCEMLKKNGVEDNIMVATEEMIKIRNTIAHITNTLSQNQIEPFGNIFYDVADTAETYLSYCLNDGLNSSRHFVYSPQEMIAYCIAVAYDGGVDDSSVHSWLTELLGDKPVGG